MGKGEAREALLVSGSGAAAAADQAFLGQITPRWTESSINVTPMNLISAVLFNSCPASVALT